MTVLTVLPYFDNTPTVCLNSAVCEATSGKPKKKWNEVEMSVAVNSAREERLWTGLMDRKSGKVRIL